MWQRSRSYEKEIIDLGPDHYTPEEYADCLRHLSRINRYFGGFGPILSCCRALASNATSFLDVGCGEGMLSHYLHREFPNSYCLGIDISTSAISQAQSLIPKDAQDKLSFQVQKDKSLDFQNGSFDVVTALLVCHHMNDEELVRFLQECHRICRQAVILGDLHRHLLAFLSFSLIAPLLFPNRLILSDGRLSIRRAFHREDWLRLLEKAGFTPDDYSLKWHWLFRWTLTIRKKCKQNS